MEQPEDANVGALTSYADAPQHEYPRRLEEMIRRCITTCSTKEYHALDTLRVRRGDPALGLLEELTSTGSSLLALGWHGSLELTRAPVLKDFLDHAECPLLVVHETPVPRIRLKVGHAIRQQKRW